jgi:DNA-binding HxlR family transcriptional regulator
MQTYICLTANAMLMQLVFRDLESYTASVAALIYLRRKALGKAYKNEIEYEMHIQANTATRTLDFLRNIKLVQVVEPTTDEKIPNVRHLYMLTDNGRRVADILHRAECALAEERKAGTIPTELEG